MDQFLVIHLQRWYKSQRIKRTKMPAVLSLAQKLKYRPCYMLFGIKTSVCVSAPGYTKEAIEIRKMGAK